MMPHEPEAPPKIHHMMIKGFSAVFGLIIAPIIVQFIWKKLDDPKPEAGTSVSAKAEPAAGKTAEGTRPDAPHVKHRVAARPVHEKASVAKASTPATIRLFNGKGLAGFYAHLGPAEPGGVPLGKDDKGTSRVFSVDDGQLHVSGRNIGSLITDQEFENYHLTLEYRWGTHTYYSRKSHVRLAGVIVHGEGTESTVRGAWMPGVRVEIAEGRTGDLVLFGGFLKKVALMAETDELKADDKAKSLTLVYHPGAPASTFSGGVIHRLGTDLSTKSSPGKVKTFEKPIGEWNTLECLCAGDTLTVLVNGKKVNAATKLSRSRGKILILSDGAEIFYRKIELKTLP